MPTLDAWDQFVWPPSAAIPQTATQAEQYGYCHGNAVDLGTVMPAMKFRVTDEEGTYLCAARGLIFEGSILAYNPTRDEGECIPACRVANDLSWAEERMAVTLANFVPRAGQEADRIVELGTQTASRSLGPAASWPGLMNPLWKTRVRRWRRRMTHMSRCRRGTMSIYPHPSWRIMSVRRWRDGGESNPEALPGNETRGHGEAKPEMEP